MTMLHFPAGRPKPSLRAALVGAFIAALLAGCASQTEVAPPRERATAAQPEEVLRSRISVEVVGRGPDLVLIPGLASPRAVWSATVARLEKHFRLHLVQVAGFAGEPARANGAGEVVVPTAEDVDGYIVAQHLAPATLIGHSLGGTIALYLAETHPDHVKKAMLVDTLPYFGTLMGGPNATVQSMKPVAHAIRAGEKMPPQARAQMMASMATSPADKALVTGWSEASDPSVVGRALADDLALDLRPGLAKLSVPVTLLYPDYAPMHVPPGATDRMYRAVYAAAPRMTFVPIHDSLHFIMLDQPQQFAAALDGFLAGGLLNN